MNNKETIDFTSDNLISSATIAVFIFILFVLGGLFSWQSWNQTKDEQKQQLITVTEMGERSVSTYFTQIEFALSALGKSLLDKNENLNLKKAHSELIAFKNLYKEMLNVNLADVSGQGLVSSNFPYGSKLPSVGNEESFIQSVEELKKGASMSIARPFIGKQIKRWVCQLRYAIRDNSGEIKYIIFAVLPLDMLESFWKEAPITKHTVIGLLRDDGYMLNRYPVPEKELENVYGKPRTGALINFLVQNKFPIRGELIGKNSIDPHSILYSFKRIMNRNVTLFIMIPIPFIQNLWLERMKAPSVLFLVLILGILGAYLLMIKKSKELQSERTIAATKLVASANLAALGTMAGGIAHEIKNPLAGIILRVGLLKEHLLSPCLDAQKITENLLKIEKIVDQIVKIINGLKTFSRNSDADPMSESIISNIINDALELCQQKFRDHHIELKINIQSDAIIECRATQIGQIIMNLLNNAYDAVEILSSQWVSLDVKQIENTHTIQIIITDSGKGIPADVVEKMMRPFFTTKQVGKGTGLGLSISLGIASEHNGRLYYNNKSTNTQFVLELPIKKSISYQVAS